MFQFIYAKDNFCISINNYLSEIVLCRNQNYPEKKLLSFSEPTQIDNLPLVLSYLKIDNSGIKRV